MAELKCETCGKIYKTQRGLRAHINKNELCRIIPEKYDFILDIILVTFSASKKRKIIEANIKSLNDDGLLIVFVDIWCVSIIQRELALCNFGFEKQIITWQPKTGDIFYGIIFKKNISHLYFDSPTLENFIETVKEKYNVNTILDNIPSRKDYSMEYNKLVKYSESYPMDAIEIMADMCMKLIKKSESSDDKSDDTIKENESHKASELDNSKKDDEYDSDSSSIDDFYLQKINIKEN